MPTRREARTSVLPEGQNLGAGGIQFRRASKNRRGPPGRRAVLGRFPPRAMTTRLPMNSTSFKIRKVERRGGGNAYAPGGAYKRFARRAKPWRRRNSVGAHLCVHPACSAGRRADEGIGPYGIRRGGRPQGASPACVPAPKKTGPARRIPEYLYLRAGRSACAGEICRFYFWNQRARPRSSRAFRVAWGSFTLARKIMAAMI